MRRRTLILVIVAMVLTGRLGGMQTIEFRIIINSKNPVSAVSVDDAKLMFFKSITLWPKGMKVRPVDLPAESPLRQEFSLRVMDRDAAAIKARWQKLLYAGEDVPVPELRSEGDVIAFVGENPGGIGYVSSKIVLPDSVKAIPLTFE